MFDVDVVNFIVMVSWLWHFSYLHVHFLVISLKENHFSFWCMQMNEGKDLKNIILMTSKVIRFFFLAFTNMNLFDVHKYLLVIILKLSMSIAMIKWFSWWTMYHKHTYTLHGPWVDDSMCLCACVWHLTGSRSYQYSKWMHYQYHALEANCVRRKRREKKTSSIFFLCVYGAKPIFRWISFEIDERVINIFNKNKSRGIYRNTELCKCFNRKPIVYSLSFRFSFYFGWSGLLWVIYSYFSFLRLSSQKLSNAKHISNWWMNNDFTEYMQYFVECWKEQFDE